MKKFPTKPSAKNIKEFQAACLGALRKSGARITKTRRAVIDALSDTAVPLSAREIYEKIEKAKASDRVDQVTVYRILEAFLERNLVHQVFPSGGYLPCFHHSCAEALHVLIRCSVCEKISELDIPQETLAPMIWFLKDEHGFMPDEHHFQLNGKCSNC